MECITCRHMRRRTPHVSYEGVLEMSLCFLVLAVWEAMAKTGASVLGF